MNAQDKAGRVWVEQLPGRWFEACSRCNGTGVTDYVWVDGGVCYKCGGAKTLSGPFSQEQLDKKHKDWEARQRRAEAKREAEAEATRAKYEAEAAEREAREAAHREANAAYKTLDAQVGDKVQVSGRVVTAVSFDGFYGVNRLVVVEDDAKHQVKMFTTAGWAWDVESGDKVVVAATVKGFSEFNGMAQTELVRPKLVK